MRRNYAYGTGDRQVAISVAIEGIADIRTSRKMSLLTLSFATINCRTAKDLFDHFVGRGK
jgi:hypothetical protein